MESLCEETVPSGTDCSNAGSELSFREALESVRKSKEYSIPEMLGLMRNVPRSSLLYWLSGERVPNQRRQAEVLQNLTDHRNPPSRRVRTRMGKLHHLIWDKQKGWECRITLKLRAKESGKRIRTRLATRDLDQAIIAKKAILEFTKQLGLEVAGCVHRRRKHLIDGKTLADSGTTTETRQGVARAKDETL
jgi:hypothetical protein